MDGPYDIILKNGKVHDGAGTPGYTADVGIKEEKIGEIGCIDPASADRVIDCTDRVVCPGFIDMHSHADLVIFKDPGASAKVMQGITTEVIGQDGISMAPVKDENKREWRTLLSGLSGDVDVQWDWNTFDEYLLAVETAKPGTNIISLVPHGCLRLWVMGMADRKATAGEIGEMKALLNESLDAGGAGMSTGLIYPPCPAADIDELTALCRTLKDHGKFFVAHMRSEDEALMAATDEMIAIARGSGAPVHISHLKAAGKAQHGRSGELLEKIDDARQNGIDITFDQYPYTAGSTMLFALLPQWAQEGGADRMLERLKNTGIRQKILESVVSRTSATGTDITDIRISGVKSAGNKELEGKNLFEAAQAVNKPLIDAVCDLLIEENLNVSMIMFTADENDVKTILKHPAGVVCTDGLLGGKPHPRLYGTFPRILGRYCRDEKVLDLSEAIRKMTSAPAKRLGLSDRGLIKEGMAADLVVFDPETVIDHATYDDPCRFPSGILHVFINGEPVVRESERKDINSGKVLRIYG